MRFALTLTLFSALCFGQKVTYNFSDQADFTKYKTYKWVEIKDGVTLDQLTDKQLKAALDAELTRKGLTKTEDANANLFVGYQVSISKETQLNTLGTGYGYGPGWRGGWGAPTMTTTTTQTINVGSLDLDMYDAAAKQLVWRGVATDTIQPAKDPEQRQKRFKKVSEKLLKNYPPKTKK
jgi:hypothetical protein